MYEVSRCANPALRRSASQGLRWVAWANLFARAHSIADTGKLSLAHATHPPFLFDSIAHMMIDVW